MQEEEYEEDESKCLYYNLILYNFRATDQYKASF